MEGGLWTYIFYAIHIILLMPSCMVVFNLRHVSFAEKPLCSSLRNLPINVRSSSKASHLALLNKGISVGFCLYLIGLR